MAQQAPQEGGYFDGSDGIERRRKNDDFSSEDKTWTAPTSADDYDDRTGEVYDPYGGKKLGMVRVRITNPTK